MRRAANAPAALSMQNEAGSKCSSKLPIEIVNLLATKVKQQEHRAENLIL